MCKLQNINKLGEDRLSMVKMWNLLIRKNEYEILMQL
jgi:hypothetical protein